MITTAFVKIWGETIGSVAWDENSGTASFEYEPKFIAQSIELAKLKMPMNNATNRICSFPELRKTKTCKGLPGLLADVLPDDYGKQ